MLPASSLSFLVSDWRFWMDVRAAESSGLRATAFSVRAVRVPVVSVRA